MRFVNDIEHLRDSEDMKILSYDEWEQEYEVIYNREYAEEFFTTPGNESDIYHIWTQIDGHCNGEFDLIVPSFHREGFVRVYRSERPWKDKNEVIVTINNFGENTQINESIQDYVKHAYFLDDGWEPEEKDYWVDIEKEVNELKTKRQVERFKVTSITDVPTSEVKALVTLYLTTNGAGWKNNRNWLTGHQISNWYGLSVLDGHVSSIKLGQNKLQGFLPPEIGELPHLHHLCLENGSIYSWRRMWDTESEIEEDGINEFANELKGDLPAEIGKLRQLHKLDLSGTELSGVIPPEIGNLEKLEILYLGINNISGPIPQEIGKLTHLYDLVLYQNNLEGIIPSEIGNLRQLKKINLSQNRLTGWIPAELGNMSNLQWLYLANNELEGPIPKQLGNSVNISQLCLSNNKLTGNIPPELGQLSCLVSLELESNRLIGTIPNELGNIRELIVLKISDNYFTGDIPMSFTKLVALRQFDFYGTNLKEPEDNEFRIWKRYVSDWN